MTPSSRPVWRTSTVAELQRERVLLVEDGNHGEYRPRSEEFVSDGVAFIRAADMEDGRILFSSASKINEKARARITKGVGASRDVLLSHKGTVGKIARVPRDAPAFVCSPQTTFWRALNYQVLDPDFLFAFMRSPMFHEQLASRAGETDMAPYVSLTSQRGLTVVLPPIDTQREIADILTALDDKIEQNRRTNEALERLARATFKSWFIDFEPVRAKADGATSFPGMPAEAFAALPTTFTTSPLGLIPHGWEGRELADIATQSREQVNPATSPFETFEHYSIPAFDNQRRASMDTGMTIRSSKFAVPSVSVLISKLNPRIPRVWLPVRPSGHRRICSTEFIVTVPRKERDLAFLYCLLQESGFRDALAQGASGTSNSHQRVTPQLILSQPVAVATDAVLDAFDAVMSSLLELVLAYRAEIGKLAEVRDYLLPRLLSGEVRVRGECMNGG